MTRLLVLLTTHPETAARLIWWPDTVRPEFTQPTLSLSLVPFALCPLCQKLFPIGQPVQKIAFSGSACEAETKYENGELAGHAAYRGYRRATPFVLR
jgi:hypothetical protein